MSVSAKRLNRVMELIDENKEGMSDDMYLKLCNSFKQMYDTKEKQFYLFTYINCKTHNSVINDDGKKIDVINVRPSINRKVAYTDLTETQLNNLIKSCKCCQKHEIKFVNIMGKVKLIGEDFSVEKKDNIHILYNKYTLISFQKVDIDEEVIEVNSDNDSDDNSDYEEDDDEEREEA